MKRVPTQDCLRKSFNTHLRKMLTRRLRPKQNSLRDFSTVPFLYKPNHLQKNVAHLVSTPWLLTSSPKIPESTQVPSTLTSTRRKNGAWGVRNPTGPRWTAMDRVGAWTLRVSSMHCCAVRRSRASAADAAKALGPAVGRLQRCWAAAAC